ncbi:HPr family phosphocarrier protein [Paenibacillus chibensis]|uniref:HPr family phosphocarrier protein n=1 Tax=Paenibacillus chibensis TaxID=59846 RepID=UPI000FD93872|nr:HPr family phosphocarrier protein [Paenibacillus chibensis]MEC0368922.1 HPr family phosphocarrier protein [Paenibacillus chibensis]
MQKTYKITNEDGIHARPATALVNTASKFKSEVFAEANNRKVTMKSILGVLSFGLEPGDLVTFIAEGEDASEVLEALDEIFAKESLGIAHA